MRQQHRRSVLESACKKHQITGRLIPVPKEITAGCGMAWMTSLENEESVVQFMSEHEIIPQGVFQVRKFKLEVKYETD